jgi:hypothetical protein
MAPSRPAVHPEQLGLVLITLLVIAGGVYALARVLFG